MTDTIFAPATVRGRSAIAVIRISGPATDAALLALCGDLPEPRKASLRRIRQADGETLDEALVIRFGAGRSFTGETSAEIQCHGGLAVVDGVLSALSALPGLRLAEPGEFARRALEASRMDLAEIEGLADLIDAETEGQRRQALRVMRGDLSRQVESWRCDLIRARALMEAVIDFADEEVPQDVTPEVRALLSGVRAELAAALAGAQAAERIRSGFEVALIGPPNAGKSTLLNALAGREAALTSDVAGTTRDVIEVHMNLRGLAVTFLDTAGLRETEDRVEALGIARARDRARNADLRIFFGEGEWAAELVQPEDVTIGAKADLGGALPGLPVSAITGLGMDGLVGRVTGILSRRAEGASIVTRLRHRRAIERAVARIDMALMTLGGDEIMLEIAAEEARAACDALDSLLGRVDVEHILDDIFASFCIGK